VLKTALTNRDPVSIWIVAYVLEILRDDLPVLVPVSTQKYTLSEHPRPANQRNKLQALLPIDLCTLQAMFKCLQGLQFQEKK